MLKKKIISIGFAVALLLIALREPVLGHNPAFTLCWNEAPFGNIVRADFQALGNHFTMNGREPVFAPRSVYGTAYVPPGNTRVRFGFSQNAVTAAGGSNAHCNADISINSLNGTWACFLPGFGVLNSGSFNLVSCGGILDEAPQGPDLNAPSN